MTQTPRPDASALLAELGYTPRLTIFLASVPGAGKTHRLLSEAIAKAKAGRRVAIGWIESKQRPHLENFITFLPRIPPRRFERDGRTVEDFDLEAALASDYELIVLDELAHSNPAGAPHAKRWQDALALRAGGKSVLGAFNVFHLDTIAPVAERIIGHPIREIVPMSLLDEADRVIALDVAPSILESRLRSGKIVRGEDIVRAQNGIYQARNLEMLRELLLRTVDQLTNPTLAPAKVSTALALVTTETALDPFLRRCSAFANALDLALETTTLEAVPMEALTRAALPLDASPIEPPERLEKGELANVRAALVIVPRGSLVDKILERPLDRDLLIADPARKPMPRRLLGTSQGRELESGDRMRIGYGELTMYLGSVAGSGKTYAMLERAHILKEEGIDVIVGFLETHGRSETAAKAEGLTCLPRLPGGEMDLQAILERRPRVVCIDELAHTNERGDGYPKRYDDVMHVLSQGIDVITSLNVQHLEGVIDSVARLTGTQVHETLPDAVLELAKEVVFIDVTPDVLRERLREGKIYPPERVESALANFFRTENLAALRELTVREILYARSNRRHERPFDRIILGVAPRSRETGMIRRVGRLAARLKVEYIVACAHRFDEPLEPMLVKELEKTTQECCGAFRQLLAEDSAEGLASFAEPTDVIVIESPRGRKHLFSGTSFARRLVKSGAAELLVLAPRQDEQCRPAAAEKHEAPE